MKAEQRIFDKQMLMESLLAELRLLKKISRDVIQVSVSEETPQSWRWWRIQQTESVQQMWETVFLLLGNKILPSYILHICGALDFINGTRMLKAEFLNNVRWVMYIDTLKIQKEEEELEILDMGIFVSWASCLLISVLRSSLALEPGLTWSTQSSYLRLTINIKFESPLVICQYSFGVKHYITQQNRKNVVAFG